MFGNRPYERTRQLFNDQFEKNGAGYLYRKNMRSAAVQVTADERDRFIAAFERSRKRVIWGLTAGIVVVIFASSLFTASTNIDVPDADIYGMVAVISVVAFVIWRRIWNAPASTLRGRSQIGVGRTRAETRRVILTRITWGQLATGYLAISYGWWRVAEGHDLLSGWWRLWIGVGAAAVILIAWQVYQKWSSGR